MESERMKYFVRPHGAKVDTLCSKEYALELYKMSGRGGKLFNLNAVENFRSGRCVNGLNFVLWGEKVSEEEIFKRILRGALYPESKELTI